MNTHRRLWILTNTVASLTLSVLLAAPSLAETQRRSLLNTTVGDRTRAVDVVIALDTSGSMDNLLDLPQIKVLVIEDDAAIRRGLRDALAFSGYAVDECPSVAPPLGRSLANIPVTLSTPPLAPLGAPRITGGRAALGVAWLAAIIAAIAVGATLRSSIDLGERRRRFVSAVTHELRTSLTTFQLYSEMLADGMVQDPAKRQQYLQTLKDESQRLSTMVANVLTHARIEAQPTTKFLEQINLGELIARLRPSLELRVASSDLTLDAVAEEPNTVPLAVDPDIIGQILANLVDNAAKYAQGSTPASIRPVGATRNGSLTLTVRDDGPGIPRGQAEAIFAPFDRDPTDRVPGVGLGLSLSRSLARDLGGDLTLETPSGGGALFRLVVPTR